MKKIKKQTLRQCSRFRCAQRKDHTCCAGCPQRTLCPSACLNHPDRCGLEDRRAT